MRRILNEAGMLARFGGIGGLATAVHLLVAAAVFSLAPKISPFIANAIAFLVAFQVSFWGHRRITFKKSGSMCRFFILSLGGFALNNGILASLIALTNISGLLAITLAMILVPLVVYLVSRFWVFV